MKTYTSYPYLLLYTHLVFVAVFSILAIIILFKLLKRKKKDDTLSYQSRLIAIGFTAIVFNKTLYWMFQSPIIVAGNNITYLLSYINANKDRIEDGENMFDINSIGNSISTFFQDFPLSRFLLAIAFFILVFRGICYFLEKGNAVFVSPSPSGPATNGINWLISNLLIVFLLCFSLFLVVSVFISIPYLNDMKKPSQFTKKNLDTTLNTISVSDTAMIVKDFKISPFPSTTLKDSITIKDTAVSRQYTRLTQQSKNQIDSYIRMIDEKVKTYSTQRADVISTIKSSIDQYKSQKILGKQKLENQFDRYSQSNSIDKDLLYVSSVDIFQNYTTGFKLSLNQMYQSISFYDAYNSSEYTRVFDVLVAHIRAYNDTLSPTVTSNTIYYNDGNFYGYNSDYLTTTLYDDFTVNIAKRDGSNWGIFGIISKYLITTESLDLVLLIGMLGFGLLGASISSFQNQKPEQDSSSQPFLDIFVTKPLIKNFWSVLVRGFSAAILIYLATKGGVAILTANVNADPNGYVLLLLCFIGAVFSEKAWEAAKTKFGL